LIYIIGDRVLAQADPTGAVSYLLTDGHGSTRALTGSSGAVTQTFNFTAFGRSLGFDPTVAGTVSTAAVFLFGGDAAYDPASGLYLHGDGTRPRDGFLFTQMDSAPGELSAPISLQKYLYAGGNPITNVDPSGHDLVELLSTVGNMVSSFGQRVAGVYRAFQAVDTVKKVLVFSGAATSALENVMNGPSSPPPLERALIGFVGGLVQGVVSLQSAGIGAGIGTAIIDAGNQQFSSDGWSWPAFGKIVADVALQAGIGLGADALVGKMLGEAEHYLVSFLISFDITFTVDAVKGIAQPKWLP
jgi:hypothetical protein